MSQELYLSKYESMAPQKMGAHSDMTKAGSCVMLNIVKHLNTRNERSFACSGEQFLELSLVRV